MVWIVIITIIITISIFVYLLIISSRERWKQVTVCVHCGCVMRLSDIPFICKGCGINIMRGDVVVKYARKEENGVWRFKED